MKNKMVYERTINIVIKRDVGTKSVVFQQEHQQRIAAVKEVHSTWRSASMSR